MTAFFFEQMPVSAQGLAEEESQGKPQYLETAFRQIMAVPFQQIVRDLLLSKFVGPTPVIAYDLFDRIKIGSSGRRGQTSQLHILEELSLERVGLCGQRQLTTRGDTTGLLGINSLLHDLYLSIPRSQKEPGPMPDGIEIV